MATGLTLCGRLLPPRAGVYLYDYSNIGTCIFRTESTKKNICNINSQIWYIYIVVGSFLNEYFGIDGIGSLLCLRISRAHTLTKGHGGRLTMSKAEDKCFVTSTFISTFSLHLPFCFRAAQYTRPKTELMIDGLWCHRADKPASMPSSPPVQETTARGCKTPLLAKQLMSDVDKRIMFHSKSGGFHC